MCGFTPTAELKPEYHLAELIRKELGVSVDAKTLRLFLIARWERVTRLAHAVHEDRA